MKQIYGVTIITINLIVEIIIKINFTVKQIIILEHQKVVDRSVFYSIILENKVTKVIENGF